MADYRVGILDEFAFQESVIDKDLTSPPSGASKGDRYLIITGDSGTDWAGKENNVTYFDGTNWQFIAPREGFFLWVDDENKYYKFDGSSWTELSSGDNLDVITVGPNGDYSTIQGAINAGSSGTTILVSEGTYSESLSGFSDNMSIIATGSRENTIITQTNATVIDLGTASGVVIVGFTLSVTSADGTTDYVYTSNNDSTSDINALRNCKLTWASSADLGGNISMIYIADGETEFENCIIDFNHTYSGTNNNSKKIFRVGNSGHTFKLINCEITTNSDCTGTHAERVFRVESGSLYMLNCIMDCDTDLLTSGYIEAFEGTGSTKFTFIGNDININAVSTGEARVIANPVLAHIVGNTIKVTTGDSDGKWLSAGTTVYAVGNLLLGDAGESLPTNHYIIGNNLNGTIHSPSNSAVYAFRNTSDQLNINDQTLTKIQLNGEDYDILSEFDSTTNYRFTAQNSGKYLITYLINWQGTSISANKRFDGRLYKNGSQIFADPSHSSASENLSNRGSVVIELDTNDYIELYVYHKEGSNNPDIAWGRLATNMTITRLF